jgi:hypothetical protein
VKGKSKKLEGKSQRESEKLEARSQKDWLKLHQRHSPNDRLVAELEAIEAKAKMPKMWNGTISSLLHSDRTI